MKRRLNYIVGSYKVKIYDYQYKSRAPVGITVSGNTLGECKNSFGEPCYFCEFESAYSIAEGQ